MPTIRRTPKSKAATTNPKDLIGVTKVPLFSVVPPASLIYEGLAMQDGARKYGPFNWRSKKVILSIYLDALGRHVLAFVDGEEFAADSKKPHLAHAKACLGIIIDAMETGNLIDDRPPRGPAADLLERWKRHAPTTEAVLGRWKKRYDAEQKRRERSRAKRGKRAR